MRVTVVVAMAGALLCATLPAEAQFEKIKPIDFKSDRYICYRVMAIGGGNEVPEFKARDQFGPGAIRVGKPEYVCNPVERSKKPIADPRQHLVCYGAQSTVRPKPVAIRNEFGTVPYVELGPAGLFCVPSEKIEVKKK